MNRQHALGQEMKNMKSIEIADEINRLPLARNGAVGKLSDRLASVATAIAAAGITVRRGGCNRGNRGTAYLYATRPGETEQRVWECQIKNGGYFTPISGKSFAGLLAELESLTMPVNA